MNYYSAECTVILQNALLFCRMHYYSAECIPCIYRIKHNFLLQIIYVSWKEELGILESKDDKITDKKLLIIVNQFRVQEVPKSYKAERFRLLSRMEIHKAIPISIHAETEVVLLAIYS